MNNFKIIWPFLILIVLMGCKSRKNFTKPTPVVVSSDSSALNKEVFPAETLLKVTLKPWIYFSSKANIEYINENDNQQVGSNIRMFKDSLIWVSINVFGIEGARILINKDSMVLYDKVHKNYKIYNKEYIESVFGAPLNVGELQNVILAQPIYSLKLYEIIQNKDGYLKIKNEQPKVFISHIYEKQFFNIDTTLIEDKTNPHHARINYFNFVNVNEHNFPLKNQIIADNGSTKIQINMEFNNPDFVTEVTFPFIIPSSYERVK